VPRRLHGTARYPTRADPSDASVPAARSHGLSHNRGRLFVLYRSRFTTKIRKVFSQQVKRTDKICRVYFVGLMRDIKPYQTVIFIAEESNSYTSVHHQPITRFTKLSQLKLLAWFLIHSRSCGRYSPTCRFSARAQSAQCTIW
jgi:hypothetical protein